MIQDIHEPHILVPLKHKANQRACSTSHPELSSIVLLGVYPDSISTCTLSVSEKDSRVDEARDIMASCEGRDDEQDGRGLRGYALTILFGGYKESTLLLEAVKGDDGSVSWDVWTVFVRSCS